MQIGLPFSATVPVVSTATGEVREVKPWKNVRDTSAAMYAELRGSGKAERDRMKVLRCLAAFKNAKGYWPTREELQADMVRKREIPNDGNPNHVAPRLTELSTGWYIVREVAGTKQRVFIPCDVVQRGIKRPTKRKLSTRRVYTWQIKERQ